jgi:topoisomerase-4 subunit A
MVSIVNRRPRLLGIIDMLKAYIDHQKEVITKRTEFDLEHAKARFHIVEGLIKALSILDEVIATIRASKNKADAENNLVIKYEFTPLQAEAIVTLQLYRLTNTDVTALQDELKNLNIIIKGLNRILENKEVLMGVIKDELNKVKEEYGKPRLTEIKAEVTEIKIDTTSLIPKEDVIVVVSKEGYVKRVSLRSYNASEDETTLKEGDYSIGLYEMNTLDTVLLFTDLGNYLYVPVHELPDMKWKELGKHISNVIVIKPEENIIGAMPVYSFDNDIYVTTFTKQGMIKRTKIDEYKVQRYSKPITNIKLKDNDLVTNVSYSKDSDVIIVTKNGYGLRFDINEVPITGVKSSGVKSINLKDDFVSNGLIIGNDYENITIVTDKGSGKRVRLNDIEKSSRARRGILVIREIKTNPHKIVKALATDTRNIIGIKTSENIINVKNSELPIMDRYSIGSNVSKDTIIDVFTLQDIISNKETSIENNKDDNNKEEKHEVSLEDIDNKMLTIDDILKDIDTE